jgi:hypothetical protein
MPTSVCGENKKAGDVDSELRCTGCGGGCEVWLVGIDGGEGVDFGGDAWQGPNDGIGLILVDTCVIQLMKQQENCNVI